jgi:hypothetical protein
LLAGACSPAAHPLLTWRAQSPAAAAEGRVAIRFVVNKRPIGRGGDKAELVGQYSGPNDVPMPIAINNDFGGGHYYQSRTLETSVRQFASDALAAAGLGVSEDMSTALLSVEVHELWIDNQTASATLELVLLDPTTQAVRTRVTFHHSSADDDTAAPACDGMGGAGGWTNQCRAMQRALNAIQADIARAFSQPPLRSAALGVAPPAPAQ